VEFGAGRAAGNAVYFFLFPKSIKSFYRSQGHHSAIQYQSLLLSGRRKTRIRAPWTESMTLIGSLNFGLQLSQSGLHPLNVFFFITSPNFPPPVCMAHGVPVHRHVDRLIYEYGQ
jgi:hypothetical protein